ncbi:OmpA family protein [Lyngbya confervoides]|uniref:OmpA family protein n=1 Tax=Lyngbya confervoides BDU141951 TaxID=1574623 RepID=A0ABD4T7Z3_9CYAN|nr:OmpA family protein [Lyngbya confervoides]MCM1984574.1 OmpA family protein [Lyngbya confervoides BDU141951]
MPESNSPDPAGLGTDLSGEGSHRELVELRALIFGRDLEAQLKAGPLSPDNVAKVLPEAISQSAAVSEDLVIATVPTVESAIKASVAQDLNVLSDALFPVIGPATRKAVATAIKNLTDSLNETLDLSVSPKSLRWRFEAWRTGRSFAEVMLLRTLLYQVEQVLLIHRQSGLLLQQVIAETLVTQDPDLVSAMLTAIEDFVKDSFSMAPEGSLDALEFGNLTLWIEEGPKAVLACLIRGTPPQDLRTLMQQKLEQIHRNFAAPLASFQGDTEALADTQIYLEDCLLAQYQPRKTNRKLLPILLVTVGVGLGGWGLWEAYHRHQWRQAIAQLDKQPGIVILETQFRHRGPRIRGLRDPLAINPKRWFEAKGLDTEAVQLQFEPYWSLSRDFIAARARKLLNPPETVQLMVDDQQVLQAVGVAPLAWVQEADRLSRRLEGLAGWNRDRLVLQEEQILAQRSQALEDQQLLFAEGSAQITGPQQQALTAIAKDLRALVQLAQQTQQSLQVTINGYASPVGGFERNVELSQIRAETVKQALVGLKVPSEVLVAKGNAPPSADGVDQSVQSQRKVTFQVSLTAAAPPGS